MAAKREPIKCRFFRDGKELGEKDLAPMRTELANRVGGAVVPYLTNNPGVYSKL